MHQPPAITVDAVTRSFGPSRAVDGVSFTVPRGQVVGLLGHNGAGKTTLIRMINGLLAPQEGTIRTHGLDPVTDGDRVRARTGVLTEYPALDDFLTPTENLAVYATIHGVDAVTAQARGARLVERLGLGEHVHLPARSLSAGLKQRLALARALVHDPELLLLDEPTSNLDPLAARGVRDLILELSREHGRTVLLSTHNMVEAQDLCDQVAIIQHGRLLAAGSLAELGGRLDHGLVHVAVAEEDRPTARRVLHERGATDLAALASGALAVRLARNDVPGAVAALVHAGVRVEGVTAQSPTLEDVYVALHGQDTVVAGVSARGPA